MLLQSKLVNLCVSTGSFKTQMMKLDSMLIMDFYGKYEFLFLKDCHVLTLHFIYYLSLDTKVFVFTAI